MTTTPEGATNRISHNELVDVERRCAQHHTFIELSIDWRIAPLHLNFTSAIAQSLSWQNKNWHCMKTQLFTMMLCCMSLHCHHIRQTVLHQE